MAQQQQPKPDRKRVEELARLLFIHRTAAGTTASHTAEHVVTRCIIDAIEFYRVWDAQPDAKP